MAEHLALQILRAIKATLTDHTRAGANVEIGRAASMYEQDAIDLLVGPDQPTSPMGVSVTGAIDSIARFYVDLHTRTLEHPEKVVENLYQLRAQTHQRLMLDTSLGGVCIAIRMQGTEDFDHFYSGDRIGAMRTVWDVHYRMAHDDPTV